MRRWLARLSFSFFIVAAWLAWEGYRSLSRQAAGRGQLFGVLCLVGALAFVALAVAGVRERHRAGGGE
ncbi:MAG: hypothetical protein ACREIT_02725 [Tepidisphaeraceae bacterium]